MSLASRRRGPRLHRLRPFIQWEWLWNEKKYLYTRTRNSDFWLKVLTVPCCAITPGVGYHIPSPWSINGPRRKGKECFIRPKKKYIYRESGRKASWSCAGGVLSHEGLPGPPGAQQNLGDRIRAPCVSISFGRCPYETVVGWLPMVLVGSLWPSHRVPQRHRQSSQ